MATPSRRTAALWVTALLALSGCASFASGDYGDGSSPQRSPSSAPKSIAISFRMASSTNGRGNAPSPASVAELRKVAFASYESSGLFSQVSGEGESTDLRAEITLTDDSTINWVLDSLCGASLLTIPSWGTEQLQMTTVFKSRDGQMLGTYQRSATVHLWFHAALLPLTPFLFPTSVQNRVHTRIHQTILADAVRAGSL